MSLLDSAIRMDEEPRQFRRKVEIMRQRGVGGCLLRKSITGAYTVIDDDAGFHLTFNDALDVNWTLTNDLVDGFWMIVTQIGAGRAAFLPGAGATVNTALAAARTRAQYSQVRVDVVSNTTGSSAVYVISGDAG